MCEYNKEVTKRELKQISPWVNYSKEVEALFKDDSDITVVYCEDLQELRLYVEGVEKAEALMQLMPLKKVFGNVELQIKVIPANQQNDSKLDLFRKAFEGNPAFSRIVEIPDYIAFSPSYVMFTPKIVQYFNDDLSDANGIKTTLYQELAKDIFDDYDGIFFCTEKLDEEKDG